MVAVEDPDPSQEAKNRNALLTLRKTRETPAGISRISSVHYRSKYGSDSMPKGPTPYL